MSRTKEQQDKANELRTEVFESQLSYNNKKAAEQINNSKDKK